jgi:hypothetical protein
MFSRGRLERGQVVALLNDRLSSAERFRSKIEVSPNGQDAYFVPVLSPERSAPAAAGDPALAADSGFTRVTHGATPVIASDGWAALPPYDCSPHVKPLYYHPPIESSQGGDSAADREAAAYLGLCTFVAQVGLRGSCALELCRRRMFEECVCSIFLFLLLDLHVHTPISRRRRFELR